MKKDRLLGIVGPAVVLAAGVYAYNRFIRPWQLRWGATDNELTEQLPGDEVKPDAGVNVTHAVTIDAPPEEVWKWLIQIGQDRGGFFSYDWLENLFDLQIRNVNEIRPELQDLKVGDFVRSAHKGWLGGRFDNVTGWYVVGIEPNRSLVLRDEIEHGSWSFVLKPLEGGRTRLIIRARGDVPETLLRKLVHYGIFEPAHFLMERKMLLTLKEKAEATDAEHKLLSEPAIAG